MKLIIQIPCFNEEETLPDVVADLPRSIPGVDEIEYLVIDDGSRDRTVEVALSLGVHHIVRIPGNRGLANAFQTGLDACLARGADIIVNTDGDNQYPGDRIADLVHPIVAGEADIVIGDRKPRAGTHYSATKKALHKVGAWAVSLAAGVEAPDPVSGFRAISREAARRLNIITQFSYTTEMVIQAARKRLRLAHVEVTVNPKTRPSRLFKSVVGFVGRSAGTILQTYALYRPLKVFTLMGTVPILLGMIPIVRFLVLAILGDSDGRLQSLTLGIGLIICGVIICVFGVLADVMARQRQLIERLLDRVAGLEERLDGQPPTAPARKGMSPGPPGPTAALPAVAAPSSPAPSTDPAAASPTLDQGGVTQA